MKDETGQRESEILGKPRFFAIGTDLPDFATGCAAEADAGFPDICVAIVVECGTARKGEALGNDFKFTEVGPRVT